MCTQPAFAQSTGGVEVGANINSAHITGSDAPNSTGSKTGLLVGGFASLSVNQMISIQPEVAYAQKHFTFTGGATSGTAEADFIEIPVLVRIGVPKSTAGAYVVVGPGFSITSRAKQTDFKLRGVAQPDQDIKDHVESSDVSVIGGVGAALGKLDVEGRYDGGLRNLNKDLNSPDPKSALDIKMRTFTILARFRFK